mmetsp:Transcript_26555/g.44547  ORF Transcript_26555/g.44547 Transcript_26555/m.44547 type:complete len:779 (+) Transcript_26555:735-3071(+)
MRITVVVMVKLNYSRSSQIRRRRRRKRSISSRRIHHHKKAKGGGGGGGGDHDEDLVDNKQFNKDDDHHGGNHNNGREGIPSGGGSFDDRHQSNGRRRRQRRGRRNAANDYGGAARRGGRGKTGSSNNDSVNRRGKNSTREVWAFGVLVSRREELPFGEEEEEEEAYSSSMHPAMEEALAVKAELRDSFLWEFAEERISFWKECASEFQRVRVSLQQRILFFSQQLSVYEDQLTNKEVRLLTTYVDKYDSSLRRHQLRSSGDSSKNNNNNLSLAISAKRSNIALRNLDPRSFYLDAGPTAPQGLSLKRRNQRALDLAYIEVCRVLLAPAHARIQAYSTSHSSSSSRNVLDINANLGSSSSIRDEKGAGRTDKPIEATEQHSNASKRKIRGNTPSNNPSSSSSSSQASGEKKKKSQGREGKIRKGKKGVGNSEEQKDNKEEREEEGEGRGSKATATAAAETSSSSSSLDLPNILLGDVGERTESFDLVDAEDIRNSDILIGYLLEEQASVEFSPLKALEVSNTNMAMYLGGVAITGFHHSLTSGGGGEGKSRGRRAAEAPHHHHHHHHSRRVQGNGSASLPCRIETDLHISPGPGESGEDGDAIALDDRDDARGECSCAGLYLVSCSLPHAPGNSTVNEAASTAKTAIRRGNTPGAYADRTPVPGHFSLTQRRRPNDNNNDKKKKKKKEKKTNSKRTQGDRGGEGGASNHGDNDGEIIAIWDNLLPLQYGSVVTQGAPFHHRHAAAGHSATQRAHTAAICTAFNPKYNRRAEVICRHGFC